MCLNSNNQIIDPSPRITKPGRFGEVLYLIRYELLVDRLFLQDVRLTAGNHEAYFVFEDLVVQILLCFSRDTQFLDHFKSTSASPPHAYTRNNMG